MFLFTLVYGVRLGVITAPSPAVLYSRPYEASTSVVHNSGIPIIGIPCGVQETECPWYCRTLDSSK